MSANQEKDPQATLDYFVDWKQEGWLGTDTISVSTWTVPVGITKESESVANGRATVWLSGGTAGTTYTVTNHITTTGGRQDERSLYVYILEK